MMMIMIGATCRPCWGEKLQNRSAPSPSNWNTGVDASRIIAAGKCSRWYVEVRNIYILNIGVAPDDLAKSIFPS